MIRGFLERFGRRLPTWIITAAEDEPYLARHYIFKKDWVPAALKYVLDRVYPSWDPFETRPIYKKFKPAMDRAKSVFLHEFLRGDNEAEFHNHPWESSVSLILAGGYVEERAIFRNGKYEVVRRTMHPGMINVIRATDFHRVALIEGKTAWTLFIAGKRTGQSWGFLDIGTHEFVPWREHLRRRYANADGQLPKSLDPEAG